ncbi:MAG TPA: protein-disulfide reductase DsbD domain-containing protein [Acidobacteriaceae bacterium]|nr:protein-disulfide reductase DsbD domain-containing protein [Acidobacteriaceae bacterium]
MRTVLAFMAGTLWLLSSSSAQKLPWQNSSSAANAANQQLVHFLYPQQVTFPAGKPQTIDLHFRIAGGLHINSHTPRQKGLIATNLAEVEPSGVKITAVDFPAGSEFAFPADPATKLSIYSGEFVLKMHIVAQAGNHLVQGVLRYQACDNSTCFPPRTVPVPIDVIAK